MFMARLLLFSCLFFILTSVSYSDNTRTEITVDYLSASGRIGSYIAGTTDAPFFVKDSYLPLKKGNFKLVQVTVWMSRPHPQPFMHDGRQPFPDPNRFAHEELNREIQTAKMQIRSIYEIGAEPLVFMVVSNKPSDMKGFQEQVTNAIKELRASAREAGRDLLLFRFGNEPESKFYWTGSREDFFETYRVWANAVKSISPGFIIDAPGFASATARYFRDEYYDEVNEFAREFLNYCKKNKAPLDVFSFHYYGASIRNLSKEIRAVKRELAKYPDLSPVFGEPKIGIDEWNIRLFGFPDRYFGIFDTSYTAAHNVGALISMLKEGAWLSIRFGGTATGGLRPLEDRPAIGDNFPAGKRFAEKKPTGPSIQDCLMLNSDGSPKPVYYGFSAFNELFSTPDLLYVNDKKGLSAIAGKSSAGENMNIIVALYDEEVAGKIVDDERIDIRGKAITSNYRVRIRNFPWPQVNEKVEIARFVVDDKNNLNKVDAKTIFKKDGAGDVSVEFEANTPSVFLVNIKWR